MSLLLTGLLLWLLSASAPASPQAESFDLKTEEDPLKKWQTLSEEKKHEILENYRYFKSLPEPEKKKFRERHKKLKILRDSLQDVDVEATNLQGEEKRRAIEKKVKTHFKQMEERIRKRMGDDRFDAEEKRPSRVKRLRCKLENVNLNKLNRYLDKMQEEGVITPQQAEETRALEHRNQRARVFEYRKHHMVREMEDLVPGEELEKLRGMEPWGFHRRMCKEQKGWRSMGPMIALTEEQQNKLQALPAGPERDEASHLFFLENLGLRLEAMGMEPEEAKQILAMPPHERERWLMKKMKYFKKHPDKVPPQLREFMEAPSRHGPGPSDGRRPSHGHSRRPSHRRGDKE